MANSISHVENLSGELIEGRYRLIELLDQGGMADVYVAIDQRLDRNVAVKIMHEDLANDKAYVKRFITEARAAAAISHPNIVQIHDQGWKIGDINAIYLVMEYVDGYNLRNILENKKVLTPLEAIKYLKPILRGLSQAHQAGIVHHDIKPENILISNQGQVKIADFGLAVEVLNPVSLVHDADEILGSANYLAPEQIETTNQETSLGDLRSDLYSCGLIFYEMLSGTQPFNAPTAMQTAINQVQTPMPLLLPNHPNINPICDDIIQLACSKDPDERYQNAQEFLTDLDYLSESLENADVSEIENNTSMISNRKRKELLTEVNNLGESMPASNSKKSNGTAQNNSTGGISRRKKKSPKIIRNRFIAAAIVIIIISGVLYFVKSSGPKLQIPLNVVGESYSLAKKDLQALGFTNFKRINAPTPSVRDGIVTSLTPGQGSVISPSSLIEITVASNLNSLSVPNIIGQDIPTALTTLSSYDLKGKVLKKLVRSDSVNTGFIAQTDPVAGTPILKGKVVNIIISSGIYETATTQNVPAKTQVAISNYVGKSSDQALNELFNSGLKVKTKFVNSKEMPAGLVISQSPDGSRPVAKGATISLTISQGNAEATPGVGEVTVPNIYTLNKAQAQKAFDSLGLIAKYDIKNSDNDAVVTEISPDAGSKVAPGSIISVTLE